MNTDALDAFTELLREIEKAEESTGMFLSGTAVVTYNDGSPIATLSLRGTGNHELVVA